MGQIASGVRFRFDADGNAQQYTDGLIGKFEKLNSTVKGELSSKLAQLFTVTAIEEAVRRTGAWADELRTAAAAMGGNVEQLQALEIAGGRVNVQTEQIIGFYDKLETAILGAFGGQQKFIQGFSAMGIKLDANKTKAEIFNEVMNKIASGTTVDAQLREIFGKQYLDVKRLGMEIGRGGGTVQKYGANVAGQIVPTENVNNLADSYHEIIQDFKEIGNILHPLAQIILNIVNGFVGMIKGTIFAASDFIKGAWNAIRHPSTALAVMGRGIQNFQLAGGGIINMIPGLSHWKGLQNWLGTGLETISGERRKNYAQAGEALGTAATFGYGPFARAGGMGGKMIAGTTKTVTGGRIGAGLEGAYTRLAATQAEGLYGPIASKLAEKITPYIFKNKISDITSDMIKDLGLTAKDMQEASTQTALGNLISEKVMGLTRVRMSEFGLKYGPVLGISGIAGMVGGTPSQSGPLPDTTTLGDLRKSAMLTGAGFGGGEGAGLSIGNVYATDLARLNRQMIDLLGIIADNTNPANYQTTQQTTSWNLGTP